MDIYFQKLSARVATSRPYAPTIHVVVLPSRLPSDLRLNFRDLDEVGVVSVPNIPRCTILIHIPCRMQVASLIT